MPKNFITNLSVPAFFVNNCYITDYNKSFEELGDFDLSESIDNLFYFGYTFSFVRSQLKNKNNWLVIYKRTQYEAIFYPTHNENEFFITLIEAEYKNYQQNLIDDSQTIHLGYVIYFFDEDYQVQEVIPSQNIYKRFGLDFNTSSPNDISELLSKQDMESLVDRIKTIVKIPNAKFDITLDVEITKGNTTHIFIRGFSTEINGRKAVLCTTIDFSYFNYLYSKLVDIENDFRNLFEQNIDIIIIVKDNNILAFNNAAKVVSAEYGLELNVGDDFNNYIENKNFPEFKELQFLKSFETKLKLVNKKTVSLKLSILPLRFSGQDALAVIIKDQTKIYELFDKITQNEKKYINILNAASDGIVLVNENGIIEFWNSAAEKIFGYAPHELINKPIYKILNGNHHQEEFEESKFRFRTQGFPHKSKDSIVSKSIRKNGEEFYAEYSLTSYKASGIWKAVGIVRDVTDKLKIEQELTKRREEITEVNKTLKRFFSIIAHDLRTPFTQIISLAEILNEFLNEIVPDNEEFEEFRTYLDLLSQSGENGLKLLEDLLQWGRAVSNNVVFDPISFNIGDLIQRKLESCETNAQKKNIKFVFEKNNIDVFADVNMVATIITNLITNALKFSHRNNEIKVSAIAENSRVVVCVADNGIGMDEDELRGLFKLDKIYKNTGTENESGTGLGLILSKELIKKNNGEIWVESQKDVGTTFCFTLPLNSDNMH